MTCIANAWTGWLDNHWPKPEDKQNALPEDPERNVCLEILSLPKEIYKNDYRCDYNKNHIASGGDNEPFYTAKTKLQFAAVCVAAPLMTQAFVNKKANDAFGEMRAAHGLKEKLVKPLKAGALQVAALANYTWTVVLGVIPIPQYLIVAAVALLASGILKGINCCVKSDKLDSLKEKLFKVGEASGFMFIPSLYGVPRAALGFFQKIGTLGLIPAYLAGRALIDCKNAIKQCCVNESENNDIF